MSYWTIVLWLVAVDCHCIPFNASQIVHGGSVWLILMVQLAVAIDIHRSIHIVTLARKQKYLNYFLIAVMSQLGTLSAHNNALQPIRIR